MITNFAHVEQALALVNDETYHDRRPPTIVERVLAREVMRLRAEEERLQGSVAGLLRELPSDD